MNPEPRLPGLAGALMGAARFGSANKYRYWLSRSIGPDGRRALFVMLNPSTANAEKNDPTIRRCIGFAKAWGYGRLGVVNLFALRSTSPRNLKLDPDPVGPENDREIDDAVRSSELVVCAWGNHGRLNGRGHRVEALIRSITTPHVLGLTKQGHPQHPLYIPSDRQPSLWTPDF